MRSRFSSPVFLAVSLPFWIEASIWMTAETHENAGQVAIQNSQLTCSFFLAIASRCFSLRRAPFFLSTWYSRGVPSKYRKEQS